jgi:hypothetical protein
VANNINNTLIGNGTTLPITSTSTSQIYVGGGGSGGVGTATYTNSNSSWTSTNGKPVMTIPHGENKVIIDGTAALEVKGRMIINGIDLDERLSTIEKLLHIPTRDVKLEEKYEKLRILSNQYKQALEEYKTWERLKNSK